MFDFITIELLFSIALVALIKVSVELYFTKKLLKKYLK